MKKEEYVGAPHSAPPSGVCAFCGYPDRRHRLWDMVLSRFKAGETLQDLATDYDYTRDQMEQWLRLAVTAPRVKRPKRKGGWQ